MRFYLDEDLSDRIAELAIAEGLDVVSSHGCGRDGLPDHEQLALAAGGGRCLVTGNWRHFAALSRQFLEDGRPHSGVLFLPRSLPGDRFAAVAGALARYEQEHPEGMSGYSVDFLRP